MTPQTQRTIEATLELAEQAADKLAAAGATDPEAGYVFGLPDCETPEDDLTLALQLIRRAQCRWRAWEESDLRYLAARMIQVHGAGHADVEGSDDDIIRVAEEESPHATMELTPEHLEAVRDMMRRAVIDIDGTRYNDEDSLPGGMVNLAQRLPGKPV